MHVLLSLLPVCTPQINQHILRKDYSDLISGKINTQMEIQGQQQSTKHALNNKQFSSDKVFSVTSPDFLSIHSHFPGSCKISWHFQVFFPDNWSFLHTDIHIHVYDNMEQSKVGNWLQQLIKTAVRNMIIRK